MQDYHNDKSRKQSLSSFTDKKSTPQGKDFNDTERF